MLLPLLGSISEAGTRARDRYLELARWHPGILALGGYGSNRKARVMCRVQMTRKSAARSWLVRKRGWRQFLDTPVPRYPVLVQVGNAIRIVETDRGGFVDVTLPGHGLEPGWHRAQIHLVNREDYLRHKAELLAGVGWGKVTPDLLVRRARELGVRLSPGLLMPIRIIGYNEKVGIVSDVDDTIMMSMVPRPLLAVRYAMVSKASSRQAVPGMAHFLRNLEVEAARAANPAVKSPGGELLAAKDVLPLAPPQFYLSTGAWNTVPTLRPFLEKMGFPRGTLLLRSWWFTDKGFLGKGSDFKLSQFKLLVEMLPHVKWILVGDNGQRDPETFTTFAQRWPDQLAAVVIRQLGTSQHLRAHGGTEQKYQGDKREIPAGVPLVYGEDGYQLQSAVQSHAFREALKERLNP